MDCGRGVRKQLNWAYTAKYIIIIHTCQPAFHFQIYVHLQMAQILYRPFWFISKTVRRVQRDTFIEQIENDNV